MEFAITCKPRNLCWHDILKLEMLLGAAMRVEVQFFPNCVPLDSTHYRVHLVENLKTGCGIVNSDRFTERAHRPVIEINRRLRRMREGPQELKTKLQLHMILLKKKDLQGRINYPSRRPNQLSMSTISGNANRRMRIKKVQNKTLFIFSPIADNTKKISRSLKRALESEAASGQPQKRTSRNPRQSISFN